MKKMKNGKGITMISLVITIVILLILAGIGINMLLGNQGIISRGIKAKEETNKAQCKETIEIAISNIVLDAQTNGENCDIEYIREKIKEKVENETSSSIKALEIDAESGTYQNILGTVEHKSGQKYEYTIYWDTYQVVMEKIAGGKDAINSTRHIITIMSENTSQGTVSKSGIVSTGESYPIYAVDQNGYIFDKWEITQGEENGTISSSTSSKTSIENITGNITVTAKFKQSSLTLATANEISKGSYAYDNNGNVIEGSKEATQQYRTVKGTIDTCSGCYYKSWTSEYETQMDKYKTMTYSTKYGVDQGGDYFWFSDINTGMKNINYIQISNLQDTRVYITYNDVSSKLLYLGESMIFRPTTSVYYSNTDNFFVSWNNYIENDNNYWIGPVVDIYKNSDETLRFRLSFHVEHYIDNGKNNSYNFYYKVYMASDPTYIVSGN